MSRPGWSRSRLCLVCGNFEENSKGKKIKRKSQKKEKMKEKKKKDLINILFYMFLQTHFT